MAPFYRAKFEKQNTGSALGWKNCMAASAAMLADQATLGLKDPTPDYVRALTNDFEGGLMANQVGTALQRMGIHTTVYDGSDGYTWQEMLADLRLGKFMCVAGDYDAIPYALKGDKNFKDYHGVFYHAAGPDSVTVGDPLNDGRATGIPKGYIQWPMDIAKKYVERFDAQVAGSSLHAVVMDLNRVRPRNGGTANIRQSATRTSAILGTISGTNRIVTGGTVTGENINGNAVWYKVWLPQASKLGYVHSSVVVKS